MPNNSFQQSKSIFSYFKIRKNGFLYITFICSKLLLLIQLYSCKPDSNIHIKPEEELKKNIYIINYFTDELNGLKFITHNDKIYFIKRKYPKYIHSLFKKHDKQILDSIKLNNTISSCDNYLIIDSNYFIVNSNTNEILKVNSKGVICNTYKYESDSIGLSGYYISYENGELHTSGYIKRQIKSNNDLINFYKSPIDYKVQFLNDSLINLNNPEIHYPAYYTQNPNLNTTIVSKTKSQDIVVYSFSLDEYVYAVKSNDKSKVKFTSDYYIKPASLDLNKTFDLNYISNLKNSYFANVTYNQYRKEFYRVMTHPPKTINKSPYSGKWSLIVADENLKTKYEVIFESEKYIYTKIIHTSNGFAIPYFENDLQDINQLILHEYELK
jgi:hypothetical protein